MHGTEPRLVPVEPVTLSLCRLPLTITATFLLHTTHSFIFSSLEAVTNIRHLARFEVLAAVFMKIQVLRETVGQQCLSSCNTSKTQMASSSETWVTDTTATYRRRRESRYTIRFIVFTILAPTWHLERLKRTANKYQYSNDDVHDGRNKYLRLRPKNNMTTAEQRCLPRWYVYQTRHQQGPKQDNTQHGPHRFAQQQPSFTIRGYSLETKAKYANAQKLAAQVTARASPPSPSA